MATLTIKKAVVATALSVGLSFGLVGSASAATVQERWEASQAGMTYLIDNQGVDGDVAGVSDWAVIAAAALGMDQGEVVNGGVSAVDYMLANPLTDEAAATDVELRVLAIVAAGQDPTDFGGVNYVNLLASYYNNEQIGDTTLLNDDIFGVLAIAVTEDASLQPMAQDAIKYLLANQADDGGFSWAISTHEWYGGSDTDNTAAALLALLAGAQMDLVDEDQASAFTGALLYLLGMQQEDGGFGYSAAYPESNGDSTAWALIALNGFDGELEAQADAARDWLLSTQNEDGSFDGYVASQTTVHSVIALLGTTWLLQPAAIEQPVVEEEPEVPVITTTPPPASTPVVTTTSNTPANDDPAPQVLSEETPAATTQTPAPTEDEQDTATEPTGSTEKKANPTWWILLGLVLVAVVWFVLQSKSKQKKN